MAITRPCASAVKVTTWSFVGKGGETMTTTALTISQDGSALDRATRLASLPEGERRRRAVEACRGVVTLTSVRTGVRDPLPTLLSFLPHFGLLARRFGPGMSLYTPRYMPR